MGNDLRKSGIDGMISLGFLDINASSLAQELVANGVDPTLGQPFHYNFFAQTPEQDNFMGLLISRTDDLEDSASVSFTLNELDESYVDAFASTPHIPRFPGGNAIWSVLIDNISVDGKNITLPQSTVRGTPSGKIVAGVEMSLKSGYMPKALHDLIYPQIDVSQGTISCYTTTTTVVVYIGFVLLLSSTDFSL
jgi:hypothetical protein